MGTSHYFIAGSPLERLNQGFKSGLLVFERGKHNANLGTQIGLGESVKSLTTQERRVAAIFTLPANQTRQNRLLCAAMGIIDANLKNKVQKSYLNAVRPGRKNKIAGIPIPLKTPATTKQMKIIETAIPPQTRSTLNAPIERQIEALRNDFSFPTLELEMTPQLARHWLEWNQCVRRRSPTVVKGLIRAINADKFPFVGDPIRLGPLDKKTLRRPLRDGQHRLAAIASADRTVRVLVMFNFSEDLFEFIDAGKPRRAADFLLQPPNVAALMAGAARFIYMIERERNFLTARLGDGRTSNLNADYLDVIRRHPAIETWAKESSRNRQMRSSAVVAASYWISATNDPRADQFLIHLYDPSGLNVTDMLYHLGERIRWRRKEYFPGEDGRRLMVWAIFQAWKFYQNGENKIIRLSRGKISWPGGAPYLLLNGNSINDAGHAQSEPSI